MSETQRADVGNIYMNKRLDFRMDKGVLWVIRIGMIVFTFIMTQIESPETTVEKIGSVALVGGFILIWLFLELDARFWRLHLTYDKCLFVNAIGVKRVFLLSNVECICPSKWGFVLRDRQGKKIAETAREGMTNAKELLPFFEYAQEQGIWNGRILKAYEIPQKRFFRADDEPVRDELVVEPGKGVFAEPIIVMVGGIVLPLVLIADRIILYTKDKNDSNIFAACMLFMLMLYMGISLGIRLSRAIRVYRNRRLILTTGECSLTEENGNRHNFSFDDIKDASVVVEGYKNRKKFMYITLADGEAFKLKYDYERRSFGKIQAFVAHHRNDEEGKL